MAQDALKDQPDTSEESEAISVEEFGRILDELQVFELPPPAEGGEYLERALVPPPLDDGEVALNLTKGQADPNAASRK